MEKLNRLIAMLKNAKFIAVNIIVAVVFALALASGDGQKIVSEFYEGLTGQKYEIFSPIEDYSHPTYIILKDKLLRDKMMQIGDADVTIFQGSELWCRYRVVFENKAFFYRVDKRSTGVWSIRQE